MSLSSCFLDESYTVEVLKVVALNALEKHRSNFPEDHRFDSFELNMQDFSRNTLIQQLDRLATEGGDSVVSGYIVKHVPEGHLLEKYNRENLANIALFLIDFYPENHYARAALYIKIFAEGISKDELIVSIIKLGGNHNLTTKDYEDILTKTSYTDVRALLEKENVSALIEVDYVIQKFYFGKILENLDNLKKQDVLNHIANWLAIFPELEILGVLEKLTKGDDNSFLGLSS